jgi:hypothetical protein
MAICMGFVADRVTLRLLSVRVLWVCFSLSDKIEWNEGAERVTNMADRSCAHRDLVGKHEGKRLLCRPRCKWKGNMKM